MLRAQGLTRLRAPEPLTLQVVPSNELEELIEPNDWQRDLENHEPLGEVQGPELEDHLGRGVRSLRTGAPRAPPLPSLGPPLLPSSAPLVGGRTRVGDRWPWPEEEGSPAEGRRTG